MSDKLPDIPMPPEEVINRDMYNGALQTGTYMALKPSHLTNQDELEALAKNKVWEKFHASQWIRFPEATSPIF